MISDRKILKVDARKILHTIDTRRYKVNIKVLNDTAEMSDIESATFFHRDNLMAQKYLAKCKYSQ